MEEGIAALMQQGRNWNCDGGRKELKLWCSKGRDWQDDDDRIWYRWRTGRVLGIGRSDGLWKHNRPRLATASSRHSLKRGHRLSAPAIRVPIPERRMHTATRAAMDRRWPLSNDTLHASMSLQQTNNKSLWATGFFEARFQYYAFDKARDRFFAASYDIIVARWSPLCSTWIFERNLVSQECPSHVFFCRCISASRVHDGDRQRRSWKITKGKVCNIVVQYLWIQEQTESRRLWEHLQHRSSLNMAAAAAAAAPRPLVSVMKNLLSHLMVCTWLSIPPSACRSQFPPSWCTQIPNPFSQTWYQYS